MKVLHLVGWYFPDSVGGSEVYVQELAARQRSSGMDVGVAAPWTRESSHYLYEGVRVFRYAIPEVPARGVAQGRQPHRGHEAIRTWLEQVRPDVLHVHSIGSGIGLDELEAARAIGARIVLTAHLPAFGFLCQRGTLLRWGTEPCDGLVDVQRCAACALEDRGAPRPLAYAMAFAGRSVPLAATLPGRAGTAFGMPGLIEWNLQRQRRLLDLVDRFVVLNARARAIVLANGGLADKVVINRLGVGFRQVPKRVARAAGEPVRVGFVGRIHPTKGVSVLAHAVRGLPRDVRISVELRGPVDDAALLEELQGAAAQDARLTLKPPVGRSDVPDLLAGYDVLCCPSSWFENGPTVALEAQAVGTPVIGTDVGAMPEFITDRVNGRIVPAGDWRALRDALAELARAPEVVEQWRRALPRTRTMDDIALDYETVYGYTRASAAVV